MTEILTKEVASDPASKPDRNAPTRQQQIELKFLNHVRAPSQKPIKAEESAFFVVKLLEEYIASARGRWKLSAKDHGTEKLSCIFGRKPRNRRRPNRTSQNENPFRQTKSRKTESRKERQGVEIGNTFRKTKETKRLSIRRRVFGCCKPLYNRYHDLSWEIVSPSMASETKQPMSEETVTFGRLERGRGQTKMS